MVSISKIEIGERNNECLLVGGIVWYILLSDVALIFSDNFKHIIKVIIKVIRVRSVNPI